MSTNRPTTFAEVLEYVCSWLDAADKVLGRLDESDVQIDLCRLADNLRTDPLFDRQIMAKMGLDFQGERDE